MGLVQTKYFLSCKFNLITIHRVRFAKSLAVLLAVCNIHILSCAFYSTDCRRQRLDKAISLDHRTKLEDNRAKLVDILGDDINVLVSCLEKFCPWDKNMKQKLELEMTTQRDRLRQYLKFLQCRTEGEYYSFLRFLRDKHESLFRESKCGKGTDLDSYCN